MSDTQISHSIAKSIWSEFGPDLSKLGFSEAFMEGFNLVELTTK